MISPDLADLPCTYRRGRRTFHGLPPSLPPSLPPTFDGLPSGTRLSTRPLCAPSSEASPPRSSGDSTAPSCSSAAALTCRASRSACPTSLASTALPSYPPQPSLPRSLSFVPSSPNLPIPTSPLPLPLPLTVNFDCAAEAPSAALTSPRASPPLPQVPRVARRVLLEARRGLHRGHRAHRGDQAAPRH